MILGCSARTWSTQRRIPRCLIWGMEIVTGDEAGWRDRRRPMTSQWFGFKDDVAVRIRAQGEGSQIDVRSVSRVGLSDLGANAARIRDILDGALMTRLRTAR